MRGKEMPQATKTFDFKIAGVPYKLKTSHDEQTVKQLVEYVNGKVSEAMSVTKNSSFQNAAVLAAFNIAEEMILLKKRAQTELEKLERTALKISENLEGPQINKVTKEINC
jgi:cell division protein ZapA